MSKNSNNEKNHAPNGLAAELVSKLEEIRLKAHLLEGELRVEWEKLDKDLGLIQSEVRRLAPEARKAALESALVAKPFLARLEGAIGRIREGLERHHQVVS
jgi:hypothetical protein